MIGASSTKPRGPDGRLLRRPARALRDLPPGLDPLIRPIVETLVWAGFRTFSSGQGGGGGSFKKPTVLFLASTRETTDRAVQALKILGFSSFKCRLVVRGRGVRKFSFGEVVFDSRIALAEGETHFHSSNRPFQRVRPKPRRTAEAMAAVEANRIRETKT